MGLFDRFKRKQAGTASDPTAENSTASEAVEKVAGLTAKGVFQAAAEASGRQKPAAEEPAPAAPAEEPKPEEDKPAEDKKPEEGKPAEDKPAEDKKPEEEAAPEAPADPAAAAVEIPAAGSHDLFKVLAKDHGAEFASTAIENGWGYVQALEARITVLEGDKKQLADRFANFAKANGGLGAPEAASFQEAGSEKSEAVKSYEEDGASPGVAGFAATISVKGHRN